MVIANMALSLTILLIVTSLHEDNGCPCPPAGQPASTPCAPSLVVQCTGLFAAAVYTSLKLSRAFWRLWGRPRVDVAHAGTADLGDQARFVAGNRHRPKMSCAMACIADRDGTAQRSPVR